MRIGIHTLFIIVLIVATTKIHAADAGCYEYPDTMVLRDEGPTLARHKPSVTVSIYDLPYSRTLSVANWKGLWRNTGVLMGAGVTTMGVLALLPEESTAWNRRNNRMPLFKRWSKHVKAGPVWDKDNAIFNYVLHPYAGGAYYMGARSQGFNCWGAFIYSFCISNLFWEYGFESFNEIPSVQDIIITPFVGSLVGECFYLVKRNIVANGYKLFGSRMLGYVVAWLVDPINETIGYFRGTQRWFHNRGVNSGKLQGTLSLAPTSGGLAGSFSLIYCF